MICPKCKSENVHIQAVSIVSNKHHGVIWWLFIGWWWIMIKWFFFTIPALIIKIFGKGKGVKTKVRQKAVCQNCGYMWNL